MWIIDIKACLDNSFLALLLGIVFLLAAFPL